MLSGEIVELILRTYKGKRQTFEEAKRFIVSGQGRILGAVAAMRVHGTDLFLPVKSLLLAASA